jgi:hypothetical protein
MLRRKAGAAEKGRSESMSDDKPVDFLGNPVYMEIAARFYRFNPPIRLENHIEYATEVGRTISEGVYFKPKDSLRFRMEVAFTKLDQYSGIAAFNWDNRNVWIHRLAALATDGEGYREIGQPSLHIAIGPEKCNVHIDEFGFIGIGPDGRPYVGPESIRHIGDELIWRAKIRPVLIKGLSLALPDAIADPAAQLLDATYIVLPGASNRYEGRVGVGVKLMDRKYYDLRFEYTCGNRDCSDNRYMVNLNLKNI